MHADPTPATARALEAAARWAARLQAVSVSGIHLLLGLLEEEEGRAATLLRGAGLDPARICAELAPNPLAPPAAQPALPFTAAAQETLFHAGTVAASLSADRTLASEHLLFALLLKDESLRARLEALGLQWPLLEATIRSLHGPALHLHEPLELEEPLQPGAGAERMETARILDAAANRAREALRVVEDYCRFVLDDAFLSGELKRVRHDLAEALAAHGPDVSTCLAARETLRDVGTAITTRHEQERHSLHAVLAANFKRLEEALRSLEEFGKLHGPALGTALEQLRYRCYTLERALVRGVTARQRLADARLYLLVTGSACAAALDWTIAEAAAGGVDIVQLREKELSDRALWERALQVRKWTRAAGILFIMNDRPDLARLVEADGVHLGQDELPVKEARRVVGPDALIGVSTHNIDQLRQAILDGADYVGVGPTFPSGTKEFGELAGLDFVRQASAETSLPAFVIGGINADNIRQAVAAGARRVAVSQAIGKADDPRRVAQNLVAELKEPRTK
jgi:thiamine-phosphate pyrophosphorylase